MAEYEEQRGSSFDDRQEQLAATIGAHFGFAADHKALASIETDETVRASLFPSPFPCPFLLICLPVGSKLQQLTQISLPPVLFASTPPNPSPVLLLWGWSLTGTVMLQVRSFLDDASCPGLVAKYDNHNQEAGVVRALHASPTGTGRTFT